MNDVEFCRVRWSTPDRVGEHICADLKPGHDVHVCCCGARQGEGEAS